MIYTSFSDLAHAMSMARHAVSTKTELLKAADELASGQKSDVASASGYNLRRIFEIDKSIGEVEVHTRAINIALSKSQATHSALETLQNSGQDLSVDMLAALGKHDMRDALLRAEVAEATLSQAVTSLNSQVGGSYLFSGEDFAKRPFADYQAIMDEVEARILAAPDAATAIADIETMFDVGGPDYNTLVYQGSPARAPATQTAESQFVYSSAHGSEVAIANTLKGLAISAVIGTRATGLSVEEKANLLQYSANQLQSAQYDIIGIRERVGRSESELQASLTTAEAAKYTLSQARNDIMGIDPYEVGTRIRELEVQAESTMVLISRLSNLTLSKYL